MNDYKDNPQELENAKANSIPVLVGNLKEEQDNDNKYILLNSIKECVNETENLEIQRDDVTYIMSLLGEKDAELRSSAIELIELILSKDQHSLFVDFLDFLGQNIELMISTELEIENYRFLISVFHIFTIYTKSQVIFYDNCKHLTNILMNLVKSFPKDFHTNNLVFFNSMVGFIGTAMDIYSLVAQNESVIEFIFLLCQISPPDDKYIVDCASVVLTYNIKKNTPPLVLQLLEFCLNKFTMFKDSILTAALDGDYTIFLRPPLKQDIMNFISRPTFSNSDLIYINVLYKFLTIDETAFFDNFWSIQLFFMLLHYNIGEFQVKIAALLLLLKLVRYNIQFLIDDIQIAQELFIFATDTYECGDYIVSHAFYKALLDVLNDHHIEDNVEFTEMLVETTYDAIDDTEEENAELSALRSTVLQRLDEYKNY